MGFEEQDLDISSIDGRIEEYLLELMLKGQSLKYRSIRGQATAEDAVNIRRREGNSQDRQVQIRRL